MFVLLLPFIMIQNGIYAIDGDIYAEDPRLTNGGNEVDDKYYYKEGTKITFIMVGLMKWDDNNNCITIGPDEDPKQKRRDLISKTEVGMGELIDFGNEIKIRVYTIQNEDNGIIKGYVTNGPAAYNVYSFEDKYIADTTAPKITWESIRLMNYGSNQIKGYFKDAKVNTGTGTYANNGYYYEYMPDIYQKNTNVPATLYLNDGRFIANYKVEDENFNDVMDSQMNGLIEGVWASFEGKYKPTGQLIYPNTNVGTLKAYKSNNIGKMFVINRALIATDKAGNSTNSKTLFENYRVIIDWLQPKVTVTPETDITNQDKITFTIRAEDQSYKINDYYGGVEGSGVDGHIEENKIKVQNGTILSTKYNDNDNTTKIEVLCGSGEVKVSVPQGAITDRCDNPSLASNVATVKVDKEAPIINDVTGVPTDWTDKTTLSVIASDAGVGGIQYSFDNGVTWSTSNKLEIAENADVNIKVKDSLGNISDTKTVSITKIDNDTPTISGVTYHEGWTNQDVEVIINASDASSGIKEYSFDGGASWQSSSKKIYTATSTINADQIKVRDYTGKEGIYSGNAINVQIDKDAPKISGVSINPEIETDGNVTITVTASDVGGSNLPQNCYSFNGGEYGESNTYTVSVNGDVTICVRDNAGNVTSIVKTIDNIKKFNPVTTIENNGGTFVMPTAGGAAKVKSVIKVEEESDVSISYIISNSTEKPADDAKWSAPVKSNRVELDMEFPSKGQYYLWAKVTNSANTKSINTMSKLYNVCESQIILNADATTWTNKDVTVDISYGEGLTENKKVKLNNNEIANSNKVVLTENGTVYAEATDIAGNKVYAEKVIDYIDKVAPVVNFEIEKTEYVFGKSDEKLEMKVTVKVEDDFDHMSCAWTKSVNDETITVDEGGCNKSSFESNAMTVTKTITPSDVGTWKFNVYAYDHAGNYTQKSTDPISVKRDIHIKTDGESVIKSVKQMNNKEYLIVNPKTTAEQLKDNVITEYNKTVDNITDESVLKTGSTLKVDTLDLEYTIIVKGDVNCDGKAEFADIVKINSIRLNKISNVSDIELLAADIDENNKIEFNDIVKLNSYLLGKTTNL